MNYCIFQLIKDASVKLKKSSYKPEEVVEIYEQIANLERIARTEGILGMEAYAMEIAKDDQYQKYQDFCLEDVLYGVNSGGTLIGAKLLLVQLTLLFVNGNGDKLEDIGIYKYLSEDYQGVEALKACMVIEGLKSVFNGEYSSTLKRLEAMVPLDVAILIQERKKVKENEGKRLAVPKVFFEAEQMNSAISVEACDTIENMTDEEIKSALKNSSLSDLLAALPILSGNARKRLFDNISIQTGNRLYKEYCKLTFVPEQESEEAVIGILNKVKSKE